MKKNVLLFHLICFIVVFVVSSAFLFYQLFVDTDSRKISLAAFLRPTFLFKATQKLRNHTVEYSENAVFTLGSDHKVKNFKGAEILTVLTNSEVNIFSVGTKKFLTELQPGVFKAVDLETQQNYVVPLDPTEKYEVLGWQDERHPILSKKSVQFDILKLDLNTQSSNTLISQISYPGDSLIMTKTGKLSLLAYPDCNPKCYIKIFDLSENKVIKEVAAFTEPSHAASLSNLNLLFFDAEKDYMAYEIPESKEIYLIDTKMNFLHYIRLENDRNLAHFISYYPQTQQLLFSLEEKDGSEQTIALVAANNPSLQVLTKSGNSKSVLASPRAGVYQVEDTLYDLNGFPIKETLVELLINAF